MANFFTFEVDKKDKLLIAVCKELSDCKTFSADGSYETLKKKVISAISTYLKIDTKYFYIVDGDETFILVQID